MSGVPPRLFESSVFAVADGAQEVNLDQSFAHNFVSAYATDANGTPLADYSGVSGKFDVEVLSLNCPVFQKPQNSSIDAKTPTDIGIEGNLLKVKVTPNNVGGATHFKVNTSQNLT